MEEFKIKDTILEYLRGDLMKSYSAFELKMNIGKYSDDLAEVNTMDFAFYLEAMDKDDNVDLQSASHGGEYYTISVQGLKFLKDGGYTHQHNEEQKAQAAEEAEKKRQREIEDKNLERARKAEKRAGRMETRAWFAFAIMVLSVVFNVLQSTIW